MRYVLFMGDQYYPQGGALDVAGWADSVDSLLGSKVLRDLMSDGCLVWWHILDTKSRKIIEGSDFNEN